jgi:4-methyl-5(b-hydroxyethyl)-thiazole monophosphate biosynthesis
MKTAAVLFADGFEEIEAVTVVDVLRRAEVDVCLVGIGGRKATGRSGITLVMEMGVVEALGREWDAVIVPGGAKGAELLRDDDSVRRLLLAQDAAHRYIGAICAGPIALGAVGVLDGRRATCYPGFEVQMAEASATSEAVVIDHHVVTSRGPGTAMAFALTLAELLVGAATASRVKKRMLVD